MQFRGNSRRHGGSNFASVQVRYSVRFTEHLTGDGATVFEHASCRAVGGHRIEADGCALSQRAVKDVAQGEEPGERGGAA